MSDVLRSSGTWYLLISWGSHPAVAGDPSIVQGLEKIELQGARSVGQAMRRAREVFRKRTSGVAVHTEDGVTYPHHPRVVYAQDVDMNIAGDDLPADKFMTIVDYDISVAKGIEPLDLDYVNSDITDEHFIGTRRGQHPVVVYLDAMEYDTNVQDVLTTLEEKGLRPADLWELMALLKDYPELQKQFKIGCMGSLWKSPSGRIRFPFLTIQHEDMRVLLLAGTTVIWQLDFYVAAVRKE